jgi:hypothetical protein
MPLYVPHEPLDVDVGSCEGRERADAPVTAR